MKVSFSTFNAIGASLVAFLVACEPPARVVGPQNSQTPHTPPSPPPPGPVFRVDAYTDTIGLVVGAARTLAVEAFDIKGNRVSAKQAIVTSSNSSVVQITESKVTSTIDLYRVLRFVGPGMADVNATLANRSYTIQVFGRAKPTNTPALVVDSFTVVEYAAGKDLVYVPLLKLREPTGKTTVEIISVEFALGSLTTGVCRGTIVYAPGTSAHVNGIDDYLWANDLIFVSPDGAGLPGDATADVLMRDAAGNYSELTVTAPVQRLVLNPTFPPPQGNGWMCL